MESKGWNRHERGSRVESDHAALWLVLANVQRLSVNFHIVELDTEHVLESDVIPVNVSLEFSLVIVAESQIGLDAILLFVLDGSQIEREHVALEKFLLDHLIKYWGDSSLSEGWVS